MGKMTDKYLQLIQILGKYRVLIDEPLSKYSSFKLGGPADLFFKATTSDDLILAIKSARMLKIPYFLMGGATNLLIADLGFRGLIVKNESGRIKLLAARGNYNTNVKNGKVNIRQIYLEADSGVSVNRLVRFSLEQGYSGLEYFLGQPGSVGGAVWINAHNMKMGKFIGEFVAGAKILNQSNRVEEVTRDYFHFGYDQSRLQKTNDIVISVIFQLGVANREKLWPVAKQALMYRGHTQPRGVYSSGCIFRNINQSDAINIATPGYTCSAGYLLDSVGMKNERRGNVSFSQEHGNFIVHRGTAKTADVIYLIKLAREKVRQKYKLELLEEIVRVGEFN